MILEKVCDTVLNLADVERNTAQQKLRERAVNFIFVVDLYNEGVHIPETLWGSQHSEVTHEDAEKRLRSNPTAIADLQAVLDDRLQHSPQIASFASSVYDPLAIHAAYARDELLVALGHWSFNNRPSQREGALHMKDRKLDVFFVTLQKSEDEYSPTTMYEDYLISHDLFHRQS
ncbi:MAG: DUF3427 domain-containing protein [Pirellulaceae bacterium]